MKPIALRVRVYRRFYSASGWMPRKLRALLQALWLGLLDTDALNDITHAGYEGAGNDGFAEESFNFRGLWPWERDAVDSGFSGCRTVLIAGAGGGREAIALAQLGFEVVAFDFSADLTEACRRHLQKADLTAQVLDAPPDRLPENLGQFDAVLVGRGFYHHVPSTERRIAFLRQCHEHLSVGAPLLLSDFFTRTTPSKGHEQSRSVANWVRRIRRCPERVELGDWLSDSVQHAFVQEEIESELAQGGFRLEFFKTSPFGEGAQLSHALGRALDKKRVS